MININFNNLKNNKKEILEKFLNKIKDKEKIYLEGSFNEKDLISPSYINLNNPKYIEIDNLFYSNLIITNSFFLIMIYY